MPAATELRRQIIDDFQAMRIPLRLEHLDAVLARAETEGMSHLEFLRALINEQANARRERSLAHRIRVAGFAHNKTLADFDWQFNAQAIDRVQIETLAGGEFISRRQNLVWVGQSGVGKSHLIEAIGQLRLCPGLSSTVRDERHDPAGVNGCAGGPHAAAVAALLCQIRPGDPR